MRALKFIERMGTSTERMSDRAIQAIRASDKCSTLVRNVPGDEQRGHVLQIYRDLTDWLSDPGSVRIEDRYIALGARRAEQGVPFHDLLWAVCIAHEQLWAYMEQECLLEEPVEFWGGVQLLHSLTQFFDRASYFASLGYGRAKQSALATPAA